MMVAVIGGLGRMSIQFLMIAINFNVGRMVKLLFKQDYFDRSLPWNPIQGNIVLF